MPYAQQHYPFERAKEFEEKFPADFIAEGIDQTRGWFYTLIVVSTCLFGKAPFKNLIANGLYGADALRLYLINSPVVRAENLRFKEEGVRDIIKDVLLPWYNAFRFLMQNIEIYQQEHGKGFYYEEKMLTKYIDYLTNWYVRMNRRRLKGEGGTEDCLMALNTLFNVLLNIVEMMAPFAPFLSDTMYQYLKHLTKSDADSVHYLMLPEPNEKLIDVEIERAVARMQSVIELGRVVRDRKTIPVKYPLPEIIARPSGSTIHRRYTVVKGLPVTQALKSLSDQEISEMVKKGHRDICGQKVGVEEVRLIFKCENLNTGTYEVNSDNDVLILLDVTPDSSMQDEGLAREIINRVQKLRKKAHLVPTDEVSVYYKCDGELERVAKEFTEFIEEETLKLKDSNVYVVLTKNCDVQVPVVKWVNVQLVGKTSKYCNHSTRGVILLEVAKRLLSFDDLRKAVANLFGVENFALRWKNGRAIESQLENLSGETIFVVSLEDGIKLPEGNGVPFCKILNFDESGVKGTVLLENPQGVPLRCDVKDVISKWVEVN
ncbi:hypothetical protein NQ317_019182, partial [Molorchus minor]